MATSHTEETTGLRARQVISTALACGLADPRSPLARRCSTDEVAMLEAAWAVIVSSHGGTALSQLGLGERSPAQTGIRPLAQWLSLDIRRRERAYQRVFGLMVSELCPPYETEYCQWKEPTHRAQQLADVAGFYSAFGLQPSRTAPERHDNIALEIEFLAFLVEKLAALRDREDRESQEHELVCREALAGFVRDHVVWWMPTFGRCLERRVDQLATDPAGDETDDDIQLLGSVGRLLCAWVAAERTANRVEPYRRIVGPQVAPQESSDSSCGSCTRCGRCDLGASGPT